MKKKMQTLIAVMPKACAALRLASKLSKYTTSLESTFNLSNTSPFKLDET